MREKREKWWFSKGNFLFQGNLGRWNILIWPDRFIDVKERWPLVSSKVNSDVAICFLASGFGLKKASKKAPPQRLHVVQPLSQNVAPSYHGDDLPWTEDLVPHPLQRASRAGCTEEKNQKTHEALLQRAASNSRKICVMKVKGVSDLWIFMNVNNARMISQDFFGVANWGNFTKSDAEPELGTTKRQDPPAPGPWRCWKWRKLRCQRSEQKHETESKGDFLHRKSKGKKGIRFQVDLWKKNSAVRLFFPPCSSQGVESWSFQCLKLSELILIAFVQCWLWFGDRPEVDKQSFCIVVSSSESETEVITDESDSDWEKIDWAPAEYQTETESSVESGLSKRRRLSQSWLADALSLGDHPRVSDLYSFMRRRETARIRKEMGLPPNQWYPAGDLMRTVFLTNVRREDMEFGKNKKFPKNEILMKCLKNMVHSWNYSSLLTQLTIRDLMFIWNRLIMLILDDFGGFPPPGRCDDPRRTGGLATRLGKMEGAWTIRQTSLGRFSGVSLCLMAHLWYQGVYTKTGLPRKPRDLEGRELATSGGCCTLLLGAWWAMLYRGVLPITPMEKVGGGCISRSQG